MAATTQQNALDQLVLEERDGKIITLRLNRPDRLNALNADLARELVHALIRAGEDKRIGAIRLIGAGRAFCAGGDLELLLRLRKRKDSKELEDLLVGAHPGDHVLDRAIRLLQLAVRLKIIDLHIHSQLFLAFEGCAHARTDLGGADHIR